MTDHGASAVANSDGLIASVMVGYDGHRGTINFAVTPEAQAQGGELMRRAETISQTLAVRCQFLCAKGQSACFVVL